MALFTKSLRFFPRQRTEALLLLFRPLSTSETPSVHLENGLPRFRVPLPSRVELCQFTMKPLSNSVGDLCDAIMGEDRGIDRVAFYTTDGIRIARSSSIEQLLINDFELHVNGRSYAVRSPLDGELSAETVSKVNDVRNLITQLSIDLNIEEFQLQREKELRMKSEKIRQELAPLEELKSKIAFASSRRTRVLTWLGLGAMGLQFGLLARLTWWEYSWDIMEPVTYFVGYGTAIAMYAYYVITRQEYLYPAVFDREYLKKFYSDASKQSFDIDLYNNLREELAGVESDLRRLRDPLLLNLPLQQRHPLPLAEGGK